jgi:aminoglycoside phosphotransferase (APT) family kinase protein
MAPQELVGILERGDIFRDWLVHEFKERIHDKKCKVQVYRFSASHTVCRYEFKGEKFGVVSKFYGEPRGGNRNYNAKRAMDREFDKLRKAERIIDVSRPLARSKEFNCALITEYVKGKSLNKYINSEDELYDRLTAVAELLRRLHDHTATDYRKDWEFARFHKVLDQVELHGRDRAKYNHLLGEWWHSPRLDRIRGCMIHNDAHPANYVFRQGRVYALDFESSWEHAHPVHDLGIMSAELKKFFGWNKKKAEKAEPYIGHFLWHYSNNENEFHEISRALPFFMSLGLLRMARWKAKFPERAYVLKEAKACLEDILR